MLRCIAIDDEPLALELLGDNISKMPNLELVASFDNALQAIAHLQTDPVDLVFLDIQMPGLTGLQFIRSIAQKPMFILVTAYEKYAIDGFNLDVVDYLLKPVSLDRFVKACNKASELFQLRKSQNEATGTELPDYFFVNADYSLVKVDYADLMYVEGLKDYVRLHLAGNASPVVARMSMKAIEDLLPANQFLRVQKSYIVSVNYISSVKKNSIFVGKAELPVGENYKAAINSIVRRGSEQ